MKGHKTWQRVLGLWLLLLLVTCGVAAAQEAGIRLKGEIGYDGYILFGRVNPLIVEITGSGETFEGTVSARIKVGYGQYDRIEMPVSIRAGESASVRIPVCPPTVQPTFDVVLYDLAGGEVAQTSVTATHTINKATVLVGVLDEEGSTLAEDIVQAGRERMGKKNTLCTLALNQASFPQTLSELSAFDALLMDRFDPSALNEEQQDILSSWMKAGGRVLLGEGRAEHSALAWFAQREALNAERLHEEAIAASVVERLMDVETQDNVTNFRLYSGVPGIQRVSIGVSIMPAVWLLAAYVLIVGFGLYALLRRGDRRKALWVAIPACSALTVVAMLGISAMLGLNKPALASSQVIVYDEDGNMYTQEHAALSYADQTRAVVSAESGEQIERRTDQYFSKYADESDAFAELRDTLTLGDSPSLELAATPPWRVRELLILSDHSPEGSVEGRAYMAEDGLHAVVENRTDILLEDAVLITGLGYLTVGDLEPGDTRELLLRREAFAFDKDGQPIAKEGVLMPYTLGGSSFVFPLVYPEELEGAFSASSLDDAEQYARSLRSSLLRMALNSESSNLSCSLVAQTSIPCTRLMLNGVAIDRMAESSALVKNLRLETQTPDGYFYIPMDSSAPWTASQQDGEAPELIAKMESDYIENEQETIVGYALGEVRPQDVTELRVVTQNLYSGWLREEMRLHVYDHGKGKWVAIDVKSCSVISGDLARRVVSEQGEVFLRISGYTGGVNAPRIVVEGIRQPDAGTDEAPEDTGEGGTMPAAGDAVSPMENEEERSEQR